VPLGLKLLLMTEKVVFSGIQPSGNLHIGNYLGAVRHWVKNQDSGMNIFCIVDMHAITVEQKSEELREATIKTAALLIAAGIDPEKSLFFIQSHNPDHANLAWILNTVISMGEMKRMTQYKEKAENRDFVSVGLFDYPALMAADILLYGTTEVPVGEDQRQHVELARDAAQRFNSRFGETFVLPKAMISKAGGRVMSLADPTKKMSKSDPNQRATVNLLDSEEEIRKKILSAVTDSDGEIIHRQDKPGIANLIEIYSELEQVSTGEVEKKFAGQSYRELKEATAETIIEALVPIQKRYGEVRKGGKLEKILGDGARRAREISGKKLAEVYDKIGFILP